MAAKRLWGDDSDDNPDRFGDKRIRRLPSFSTVIKEAVMANKMQHIFFALEPLLRKVVQEEVERTLQIHSTRLHPQRSLQMQIEAAEPSRLKLVFKSPLLLPIFTGTKIEDSESNSLQILVVDARNNVEAPPALLHLPPLKVELVVLEGDFAYGDEEDWTSEQFQKKIVKERPGKRPLLVGADVNVVLKDGVAAISDLNFTDNSSWEKTGKFKIGARVVPGSYHGSRIREAMTEAFKVRDHRGESYKKHHPPALRDEVWRLEKIGKDGKFHSKLAAGNINTVQDFLKLCYIDPDRLRRILGTGMSDRLWEVTSNHAKTCVTDDKLYLHRGQQYNLILNSVCQVVRIITSTDTYSSQDLSRLDRTVLNQLAREAYENWGNVEEYNEFSNASIPLAQNVQMPQGAVYVGPSTSYTHQENGAYQPGEYGFDHDPSQLPF